MKKLSIFIRVALATILLAALVSLGSLATAQAAAPPHPTPTPGANVTVVNPESSPVLTRDVENPANRPFAKALCRSTTQVGETDPCLSLEPPLPSSFVVPSATSSGASVKRLVIDFVSGYCAGTGRADFVKILSRPSGALTTHDTGDNFTDNYFPLAVAQFIAPVGVNGVASFAQMTRIYLDQGVEVSISADIAASGSLSCKAHLSGHFVVN